MSDLIAIKCPECGADLEVKDGRDSYFCSYCGAKVVRERGETVHRIVDEARLAEIENEREIRADRDKRWKEYNEAADATLKKMNIFCFVYFLLYILFLATKGYLQTKFSSLNFELISALLMLPSFMIFLFWLINLIGSLPSARREEFEKQEAFNEMIKNSSGSLTMKKGPFGSQRIIVEGLDKKLKELEQQDSRKKQI